MRKIEIESVPGNLNGKPAIIKNGVPPLLWDMLHSLNIFRTFPAKCDVGFIFM